MSFKSVNLTAELGYDISQAVDCDNRKRIIHGQTPTAKQLNSRLSRWIVIDKNHLGMVKRRHYKWLWWLLVMGILWWIL